MAFLAYIQGKFWKISGNISLLLSCQGSSDSLTGWIELLQESALNSTHSLELPFRNGNDRPTLLPPAFMTTDLKITMCQTFYHFNIHQTYLHIYNPNLV